MLCLVFTGAEETGRVEYEHEVDDLQAEPTLLLKLKLAKMALVAKKLKLLALPKLKKLSIFGLGAFAGGALGGRKQPDANTDYPSSYSY